MKLSTKELYKHCYGSYAIPAVNVAFMEQILALFAAASEADAPVIVQTTPLQRDYAGPVMLQSMITAASAIYPEVVFVAHIDHGDIEHVEHAIASDHYTSVMIDASHEPFEENVRITSDIVRIAAPKQITVEAELGVLSGVEDNLTISEESAYYTNPEHVETFVRRTRCDSLAIAVGTSHGAYKFSGGQGIQFHILEEIQKRLPGFPLVLHGGSAVDPEEIRRINAAGGSIAPHAKGVAPDELRESIRYGICKINLATDLRILWTRVVREHFIENPGAFRPIEVGKKYMDAYKELMIQKFELFNAAGQASKFVNYVRREVQE